MADQNLRININLAGISSSAQHLLQAATYMVAIGLNGKNQLAEDALEIPGVPITNRFNASSPWSLERAAEEWEIWVLRNGFRDVAEAIGILFESAHTVLSYWALMLLQKEKGSLLGSDWNELVVARQQRFHRKTLPQRIEYLEKHYSFSFPEDQIERLKSINAARNCLVHRHGIVSHEDVLPGQDSLVLRWATLATYLDQDGKITEVVPPIVIEPGGRLSVQLQERTKTFAVGEHLMLSAAEFGEICMSLFQFSAVCSERLGEYGKSAGIEFESGAS